MIKRFLVLILLLCLTPCFAAEQTQTSSNITTYSQNEKWGLKDSSNNILLEPTYKRLIRVGNNSWIAQNKKNKYGLIDSNGNILVPLKYIHADRIVNKFAKFGNYNDYGLYDEYGNQIIPQNYRKIEILYGKMFLTYKNYKYGIIGYDGKVILDNEFDDIYMPKPNVMRLQYKTRWYEIEQVKAETLTLPAEAKNTLKESEDFNLGNIVINTGVVSGYSVLTFSDYVIKLISSISPAHEETIDELLLSQGTDTVDILMKLTWLPKYPFVFGRKYYENVRNPNNGPLSNVRSELIQQIK